MTRTVAQNGQLALLLEVATTPTPGNVDRHRAYDDLRFEHFLAGAVGTGEGLDALADPDGPPIGHAFERAIEGMSQQSGGNTQFGGVLLLAPLIRAAALEEVTPEEASRVAESTGVADAVGFYRAFEHVDVAVEDPPADMDALDVRRASEAIPHLRQADLSLYDVMARSADRDGIAREWTNGFERTFETAERIRDGDGPVTDRCSQVFLALLAEEPDTFVATNHGQAMAEEVSARAQRVQTGREDVEAFADDLVADDINPGTTADILAGGLFVALQEGLEI